MTTVINAAAIASSDLEESLLAPPSAEPLSGDIVVRSRLFFTDDDRKVVSGTWESEPGTSRWEFDTRAEIITVLSGSMTVTRDGENPTTIAAGDTAYFPIGWAGTWDVHEKLRKVFVVYLA